MTTCVRTIMLVVALWLTILAAPAQTLESWDVLTEHSQAIRAQSVEYIPYVRPFAVNGTFTTRKPDSTPISAAQAKFGAVPQELQPAGTEIETGAEGAISLLLGETGEAGFARLGPDTLVRLPQPATVTGSTEESATPGFYTVNSYSDARPHSMEFQRGSLCLNVKAGQLVHNPVIPYKMYRFRLDTDFVLVTPQAMIATKNAGFHCIHIDGKETIGVLAGSIRVTVQASGETKVLMSGKVLEIVDGVVKKMRDISDAEREAWSRENELAMPDITPLDVFTTPIRRTRTPWKGWSHEKKDPFVDWMSWRETHSSVDFDSDIANLTEQGVLKISMSRSQRFFQRLFPLRVFVREGESKINQKGVVSQPSVSINRQMALRFQMRVINIDRLLYYYNERLPVPEHLIWLNSRAGEWQDYHLPLTMASSQSATAPPREIVEGGGRLRFRFDAGNPSIKLVPPVDQVIIEMKDFRAVTLP